MRNRNRRTSDRNRSRVTDAIRQEFPDVGEFKVLDIVEGRSGDDVLLHHASGTIQWVYVEVGYDRDANQEGA